MKGDLFKTGWKWDTNTTYSRLQEHANISGYYFASKLNAAVGPSFLMTACRPAAPPAAPIDQRLYSGQLVRSVRPRTPRADRPSANYNTDYVYTYKAVDVDFTGKVWTLPAGDLQAAVGFEYNDQHGDSSPIRP